ncbi:glycoside hydrolase family 13 protein [Halalkalibaculum sp. DA3122]|uniref:glycoside hydrolase family 13 protein n=1 Tax=unclassified Halalkalibaculum TaxID=2964617 RepID=UPI003754B585
MMQHPSKDITVKETREKVPYKTPEWAKHVIWYQIFPERFRNGDPTNDPTADRVNGPEGWEISPWTGDWYQRAEWEKKLGPKFRDSVFHRRYGGDLQGILDKLDYIEELGIGGIYLNPVFDAVSLHKYDTSHYHHVDRFFGPDPEGDVAIMEQEDPADPSTWQWTSADKLFLELIEEVHSRGMRIIIDGVFNHSGSDFWAFRDLKENQQESPFRDWYDVISFNHQDGSEFAYHGWWGIKDLPEFQAQNGTLIEPVRQHIFDITRRWMDPNSDGDPSDGIDGWRLDVPEEVGQDFWIEWHQVVRGINPEAFTVGEIWTDNAVNYINAEQFNASMNYRFFQAVEEYMIDRDIGVEDFSNWLDEIRNSYPEEANYVLQNLMESHDTPRLASIIVNSGRKFDQWGLPADGFKVRKPNAKERQLQKLIALLQYTYIGAPMVFYGTEAGMWGADDPDDRKPMVWPDMEYEDETTHPIKGMQRPADSNEFDRDLFNWYKKLGQIRNRHELLRTGQYLNIVSRDDLFAFGRHRKKENPMIVVLNRSDKDRKVTLDLSPFIATPDTYRNLLDETMVKVTLENKVTLQVSALSGVILEPQ